MKPALVFIGSVLAVLSLVLFLTSCSTVEDRPTLPPKTATTSTADINQTLAKLATQSSMSSSDYHIGPEDLIEITLFNIPEAYGMERHVTPRLTAIRVSQKGQISMPLLGQLNVMGLTVSELEQKLRDA